MIESTREEGVFLAVKRFRVEIGEILSFASYESRGASLTSWVFSEGYDNFPMAKAAAERLARDNEYVRIRDTEVSG